MTDVTSGPRTFGALDIFLREKVRGALQHAELDLRRRDSGESGLRRVGRTAGRYNNQINVFF